MFNFTFLTPEKKLIEDVPVQEVFLPGHLGEMHILPGHAPMMTTMRTGVLKYRLEGSQKLEVAAISWGYAQVSPQGVNILAETAETPEEIDTARAKLAEKKAETELGNLDLDAELIEKNIAKLERARIRQEVAEQKPSR